MNLKLLQGHSTVRLFTSSDHRIFRLKIFLMATHCPIAIKWLGRKMPIAVVIPNMLQSECVFVLCLTTWHTVAHHSCILKVSTHSRNVIRGSMTRLDVSLISKTVDVEVKSVEHGIPRQEDRASRGKAHLTTQDSGIVVIPHLSADRPRSVIVVS